MAIDIAQFGPPIDVFRAAIGNPAPLAELLRSDRQLYEIKREAIAMLVSGELKPPKRRKELPPKQTTLDWLTGPLPIEMRKKNAVSLVRSIMKELRERGEAYGRFEDVIAFVADLDGLPAQQIIDGYRRARVPEKPEAQEHRSLHAAIQAQFLEWCHRNWEEVQQFRGRKST